MPSPGFAAGVMIRELRLPFSSDAVFQLLFSAIAVAALAASGFLLYEPGLSGGFIFDDVANLGRLAAIGDINSVQRLVAFLLSSDSLHGRPLSLLTFVLDDQSWPLDSYTLKRTNLLVHLLNSLLVLWFSYLLLSRLGRTSLATLAMALLVAALWMSNPLQVSTVSYIIQRMTELSAAFVLIGLVAYLKIRPYLDRHFGLVVMALSLAALVLMSLGIASKESALLLTLYWALLESTLFRSPIERSVWRRCCWIVWKGVCFFGPLTLFLIYWLWKTSLLTTGYEYRQFTLAERLLTEARVVVGYIFSILLPKLSHTGLFTADVALSTGLFRPFTTLLAMILLAAVAFLSWALRRRYPVASFGLAFFLAGHLLESTIIPLELYFEHRNYLPQLGIWLVMVQLLCVLGAVIGRAVTMGFAIAYLALFFFVSFNSASLWGSDRTLSQVWYRNNPGSLRAIQFYAHESFEAGAIDEALQALESGIQVHPDVLSLPLSVAILKCGNSDYRFDVDGMVALAKQGPMETAAFESIQILESIAVAANRCDGLDVEAIRRLYEALLANPLYASEKLSRSRILEQLALLAVDDRNLNDAMYYFDAACEASCSAVIRARQAQMLASAGLYEEARKYLSAAELLLIKGRLESIKNPRAVEYVNSVKVQLQSESN